MLHVQRAASGSSLVQALAALLAEPLGDPFAIEVVAVPAKGVERWLSQRLSHHLGSATNEDGVCAGVSFPSPARLLDEAVAAVSPEHATTTEAWSPENATWPLLEILDGLPRDDVFAPVHHYLDGGDSRRYALAAKVARLFDSYAQDRPELVTTWKSIPPDLAWQREIWLRLRERLGPSPAELHDDAIAKLEGADARTRLSLYGVSRLTKTRLDVLAAIAKSSDVHLFVHHPGAALWDGEANHPLLASLSKDVQDLRTRLLTAVPGLQTHVHDEATTQEDLLHRLQHDLRTDTVPAEKSGVADDDSSVQVHACHGQARQVEVLREVVLGLLKADETLEPRDILVMCPDVERYAPLVKAVFDTDSHPGGRLRVSIADRSPVQTNPLLGLAARLLELAGSRVTGPQVLDLAGLPAVRQQFGLSDDDLEQLRGWIVAANVHWGLDGESREPWGLQGLDHGTWRVGLDRLLAGVALGGSDTPYAGVLPVGGIDSTGIELVGRFAEMLDRLQAALESLQGKRSVTDWMAVLEKAVLQLGGVPWDGAWQVAQLGRELGDVGQAAVELTLTDVRVLLEQRLAGRPTRSSFRTGALTFCTMTPMRSVPHRVICLLGLDDTAFPRHGIPDGDNLLGRDPRSGERDPRREDRQLFLDAILAAQDHLVILYTGADVRTGAELPPAVPVGEVLDALDLTAAGAREHVVTKHPLQPFDPNNFLVPEPFSFDSTAFAGAKALRGTRVARVPFLPAPLDPVEPGVVTLRQVKDFWEHPVKAFLRQRLEVGAASRADEPQEALPLELDNLQQWAVGDRVLTGRMAGRGRDAVAAAEHARGGLPSGVLGDQLLQTVQARVDALGSTAKPWWVTADDVEIDLPLSGGWHLTGSVALRDEVVLQVGYSTLGSKQRLRGWLDLLAATVTLQKPLRAVVVGRRKDDARAEAFGPVAPDRALGWLDELVALRALGLRSPMPLALDCVAAYASARKLGSGSDTARDEAKKKWEGSYNYPGPVADAENVLVFGEDLPFKEIWEWASSVPLGVTGEPSDFGTLACCVWNPLLEAEATP